MQQKSKFTISMWPTCRKVLQLIFSFFSFSIANEDFENQQLRWPVYKQYNAHSLRIAFI